MADFQQQPLAIFEGMPVPPCWHAAIACLYGGLLAFCHQQHLGVICSFKLFCFSSLCLELHK